MRVALHLPSQSASHPSGLPAAKHTHTGPSSPAVIPLSVLLSWVGAVCAACVLRRSKSTLTYVACIATPSHSVCLSAAIEPLLCISLQSEQ